MKEHKQKQITNSQNLLKMYPYWFLWFLYFFNEKRSVIILKLAINYNHFQVIPVTYSTSEKVTILTSNYNKRYNLD